MSTRQVYLLKLHKKVRTVKIVGATTLTSQGKNDIDLQVTFTSLCLFYNVFATDVVVVVATAAWRRGHSGQNQCKMYRQSPVKSPDIKTLK